MKPKKLCGLCGTELNSYHLGNICYPCQKKRIEYILNSDDKPNYDVHDMAYILGMSEEQVRRLIKANKLPPPLIEGGTFQWPKDIIHKWIESKYRSFLGPSDEEKAMKLALKQGVPIERLTLNGHYPQGLLKWYQEWKHLDDE